MGVSKVIVNGVTKVDLTQDTVTDSDLSLGKSAHNCAGNLIAGTNFGFDPTDGVERDINFFDYDGTLLYSYTYDGFEELDALPANPSHSGLTAQGWNWTMAEIITQIDTCPGSRIDVGQMYITDDEKTRLYCHFESGGLSPYLGISPNGTVVIDFGDGSEPETLTGTSFSSSYVKFLQHTYSAPGDYVITITVQNGEFSIGGNYSYYSYIFRRMNSASTTKEYNMTYLGSLRKIEFGSNVRLYDYAFYHCDNLEYVTMPSTLSYMNQYAFYYCYSLKFIVIPRVITSVASSAFYCCYSLVGASIPPTTTSFGNSSLSNCYSLRHITLPYGLTNVANNLFYYDYSLEGPIVIPPLATYVGAGTFNYCVALDNISFARRTADIYIGSNAFSYCQSLQYIFIPSQVTRIEGSAFSYCSSLKTVAFQDGASIQFGTYVFQYCYALERIDLPMIRTDILSNMFYYCTALKSVGLPLNMPSIPQAMFYCCYALSSITIPASVTSIGNQAFYNCYGLMEYHFMSTSVPSLANINAFNNIYSGCKIYVPYSSSQTYLTAYQGATNWSTYSSKIAEEPEGWRRILTDFRINGTCTIGQEFTVPHDKYGSFTFVTRRINVDQITGNPTANTITIQSKYITHLYSDTTTAGGYPFDSAEAFHEALTEKIPAGTVCKFTVNTGGSQPATAWTAGTYHFTATAGIPRKAMLCISSHNANSTLTDLKVAVYRSQKPGSPIYEYQIYSGAGDATVNLGTWGTDSSCNHSDRVNYGSDNAAEANITQFLNANTFTKTIGSVFVPKTKFDMLDPMYSDSAGFLTYFPADFRCALRWCNVHNITNGVYESPDSEYTVNSDYTYSARMWIPSSKEVYGYSVNSNENSEAQFPVYVGTNNAAKALTTRDGNTYYPYILRTPYDGDAHYVMCNYVDEGEMAIPANLVLAIAPMAVLG